MKTFPNIFYKIVVGLNKNSITVKVISSNKWNIKHFLYFSFLQGDRVLPWLLNLYMDGMVREVNARLLGKGLDLLRANGGRFERNQPSFVDDTALVADRWKLRVNVGKSKVMRWSRYVNMCWIHVRLYGEQISRTGEPVRRNGVPDTVNRMNEKYETRWALKSVLSNRRLEINSNKCLYEGVIIIIVIKSSSIGPSGKNKIVYKLFS